MLADQFSKVFREEHRQIRDALLDLISAYSKRDQDQIQSLLQQVATLTGPHFRYEEETLYPALTAIFGQEYVESLLSDHDSAIGTAKKLVDLAGKGSLSEEEANQAVSMVRGVLPHVSDCDGLSIMVERLPEKQVQSILDARDRSNQAGLNLIQWASQIRKRSAAAVA